VYDLHQVDNRDPFVFKTTDFGRTFKPIVGGVAKSPLSYAHALREDPARRGLLYLGTENGLYVSFDDGGQWQPLQSGLPHAPVYGLAVQERFGDLVVATYGRGFWILDDLTPLRQFAGTAPKEAQLLPPRPTYRFRTVIDQYQTTTGTPEALERLVECYLALGMPEEAQKAGAVLGRNYPESYWYKQSLRLLGRENKQVQRRTASRK